MPNETAVDPETGRKYFLDFPRETGGGLTFLLNLHGAGSVGMWQRLYFPAHDHVDDHRLVVATPSAATKQPFRHWATEVDDQHLRNIVAQVCDRFGPDNIRAFWLVGHSQGGMTANRLLTDPFFADRVDGWLSLSGGRIGQAPLVEGFGPPRTPEQRAAMAQARGRFPTPTVPDADFSFIYATGEYEINALPETSPWAQKYGAGPRVRMPDVHDTAVGQVHDTRWDGRSTPSWGGEPAPGTAEVYVYPGARDGRVIADVVRKGKDTPRGWSRGSPKSCSSSSSPPPTARPPPSARGPNEGAERPPAPGAHDAHYAQRTCSDSPSDSPEWRSLTGRGLEVGPLRAPVSGVR